MFSVCTHHPIANAAAPTAIGRVSNLEYRLCQYAPTTGSRSARFRYDLERTVGPHPSRAMSVRQAPHSDHPQTIRFPIVLRETIVPTTQVPMYRHRVGRGHARRGRRVCPGVSSHFCAALRWVLDSYIVGNCLTTL